jgi:ABC-type lipoprotein release transport system permease subunit
MAIPIAYNVRNIVQRPWSTLMTALGIALVVAILIGALALASGFQAALVENGSSDNAMILRTGADSEISSSISLDQAAILRAHPQVAAGPDGRPLVSNDLVVLTNLERVGQQGSSNVPIRGIDPAGLAVRPQIRVVEGRMFAPGTDELIVGRRIAPRFRNTAIGDRLRFGQRDFTVVGQFTAGGTAFESEIFGDQAVLGPAFDRPGFQSVTFRMRDPSRIRELEKELEADPRLGVQVQTEREFYASQSRLLATVIRIGGVFITLIIAVGAIFGAMNTMYAAVGSRTREIAVLLTLGFAPWAIMTSFILESVLLSLVGGVLGVLLALPINGITTSTTNWSSFSEVAFAFRVTPVAAAIGVMFAGIMGVVGGFFPALKAARQSLAASMRAA